MPSTTDPGSAETTSKPHHSLKLAVLLSWRNPASASGSVDMSVSFRAVGNHAQGRHRLHAGARALGAFADEMRCEEATMVLVLVKVAWREHRREHRHVAVELHAHEGVDHARGDELVPVDAAVD